MDERKLTDLFQSAVRDVPPASFDEKDVAAAARRVTARKRSMIAGGSAFAVVAIAVGVLVAGNPFGHTLSGTASNAASGAAAGRRPDTGQTTFGENLAPRAATGGGPQDASPPDKGTGFPTTTPMQGGGGVGGVGPDAGSTPSGCGPTDRQLAVALANELASVGAPQGVPATLSCPPGSRTAGYLVHDGSAVGYVVAVVTPAGKGRPGDTTVGAVRANATGGGGRGITVLSVPSSGSAAAPLSGAVIGIANDLAVKF